MRTIRLLLIALICFIANQNILAVCTISATAPATICSTTTIPCIIQGAGAFTTATWSVSVGGGGFSGQMDSTITWNPPAVGGTFTISVLLAGGLCAGQTINKVITTTSDVPLPTITFTVPPIICATTAITLTVNSAGAFTTATWSVTGGGILSNQAGNTISWNPPAVGGTFTITVVLVGGNCPGTITQPITTTSDVPLPTITFTVPPIICATTAITLTVNSAGAFTTATWSVTGGGILSNQSGNSISYNPPSAGGTFSITLVLVGGNCPGTITQSITTTSDVTLPSITFTVPPTICATTAITLTISAAGGFSSATWSATDGVLSNQVGNTISWNPPAVGGTFNVTVVLVGGNCPGTITQPITTTSDVPLPTITVIPTTPFCQNEIDTITAVASNATSFTWTVGNGVTTSTSTFNGTATNQNYVLDWNSSYSGATGITVTATNACGTTSPVSPLNIPSVRGLPSSSFSVNDLTQCSDIQNFDFTYSTPQTLYEYLWNYTGVTNATTQNKSDITFSTCGVKAISLMVTDSVGCNSSSFQNVTVMPTPVSVFSFASGALCEDVSIAFTSTSTNNSGCAGTVTSTWNFGDSEGDLTAPHTYTNAGTFSVQLIANIGECDDTTSQSIIIQPAPVAAYTVNATPQCASENEFIFTNTSTISGGTITNYQWQWNGSNVAITEDYTHPQTTVGTYPVSLMATSNFGCITTANSTVAVVANPVISVINLVADTAPFFEYCVGDLVSVDATGTNATVLWTLPDTTFSTIDFSLAANTNLTGQFNLQITAGSCSTDSTFSIIIHPNPNAVATSTSPYCEGETIALNEINATLDHSWTGPNNFESNLQSPNLASAEPTYTSIPLGANFIVIVTDQNNCTATDTVNVIVHPSPTISSALPDDIALCSGEMTEEISFTGLPNNVVFNWGIDNDFFDNLNPVGVGNIPSSTVTNATTSPIVANVTITPTANGCAAINTQSYTVVVNPIPQLVALVVPSIICDGAENLFFSASSGAADGSTYQYVWTSAQVGFITNVQGTNATLSSIPTGDSFEIEVEAVNDYDCITTITQTVEISDAQAPEGGSITLLGADSVALVLQLADNNLSYQWGCMDQITLARQIIVGATFQQLFEDEIGDWNFQDKDYFVIITNAEGCQTVTFFGDTFSSVAELENQSFVVVPNPNQGAIRISGSDAIKYISLFDTNGAVVLRQTIGTNNERQVPLSFQNQSSGLYVLQVTYSNGKTSYQRIIIQ